MSLAPLPTLKESVDLLAAGHTTPTALVEQALARIEATQPTLHAFISVTAERALAAARQAEKDIAAGKRRGPLHGIPYGLKDIIDVEGIRTTAHSHLLVDNVARHDAFVTQKLEAAGMVLMGKLATHEFAFSSPNDEGPFPSACNPWNVDHFCGGSSSGSGAAVAAGLLPLALGTDTGGSIRLPAAYCGIVGMKATYGRVSRRGVLPLAQSLDHVGPLTRTVEDCALAMQALAGHDPQDPGCANVPVPDYLAALNLGVKGLRIGYARQFSQQARVDAEQTQAIEAGLDVLASLGAEIIDVELPPLEQLYASVWTICHAEAFAIHQQSLRARPQDYARVTRERLMVGAFVSGPQLAQAQRLRRQLADQVQTVFGHCDVIINAAIPSAAPPLSQVDDKPWRMAQPITSCLNATGHPAMTLPCAFSADGLPLSMQIVGPMFDEATVMRVGQAYQGATGWHQQRPAVLSSDA